jgi:hypothetical protein
MCIQIFFACVSISLKILGGQDLKNFFQKAFMFIITRILELSWDYFKWKLSMCVFYYIINLNFCSKPLRVGLELWILRGDIFYFLPWAKARHFSKKKKKISVLEGDIEIFLGLVVIICFVTISFLWVFVYFP